MEEEAKQCGCGPECECGSECTCGGEGCSCGDTCDCGCGHKNGEEEAEPIV